jgi:hypothetical protein
MAIGRIHEVDLAESALLHEGEHEGVDLGSDWLHDVERK